MNDGQIPGTKPGMPFGYFIMVFAQMGEIKGDPLYKELHKIRPVFEKILLEKPLNGYDKTVLQGSLRMVEELANSFEKASTSGITIHHAGNTVNGKDLIGVRQNIRTGLAPLFHELAATYRITLAPPAGAQRGQG